jgi:hypothetical protein
VNLSKTYIQTSLSAGFFLTKGEKKAFQNTWKDCEGSWPCIIVAVVVVVVVVTTTTTTTTTTTKK